MLATKFIMKPRILPTLAAALAFASAAIAQNAPRFEFPAPSTTATLKQRVGITDIEIVYSRPGMKGRPIYGGLVPYGEVWRTGANNATKLTFSTEVKLNGNTIPAGTYALFTIPGEKEWTIIINKGAAQWGVFQYDEKVDVVRFKASPMKISQPVETFTMEFNDITDDSARLDLIWDHTVVPIKFETDLTSPEKFVPRIEEALAGENAGRYYYPAAMYFYDHGLDLQKAKKWIDAALAQREAHYMVHLKAKILAKLGDKEGAIAAAKHSTELVIAAKDKGYVKLNEALIASLK